MAPAKKKARKEEPSDSLVTSNDDSFSGLIRLEVNVSDIPNGIFSPEIEVLGTPWKIRVTKMASSQTMAAYLYHRTSDSIIWSINVSCELKLINVDAGKHCIKSFSTTFNHENGNLGLPEFIDWADLVNEDQGFIKDGKIIIEASFTLSKLVGIRVTPRFDFTDSNKPFHDVTLLIGGEKIYASKQILAVHSPVFEAMFYGKFDESNKSEIELKEVDPQEFIGVLNLLYPMDAKISDTNVEYLLKLADRFQIKTIIDQAEKFLIDSTKLITWKLNLSDQYRLVKLQENCLDLLKTSEDIKNMKTMDGYKEFSSNINKMLLEKMINFA